MDLRKRLFAILMSLTMVLTYMPAMAFAAAENPADTDAPVAEEAAQNSEEEVVSDTDVQETVQEEESVVDDSDTQEEAPAETSAPSSETEDVTSEEPAAKDNNDADKGSAPIVISADPVTDTVKGGSRLGDSDDLLQQYVDDKVKEELAASDSSRQYSRSRKTNLTGADLKIYKALVSQIREVASGESTDTSFHIRMDEVFGQLSYTAEELYVDEILVDSGEVDEEGDPIYVVDEDALSEFNFYFEYNFEAIKDALIADYPYELYWFDKTVGIRCTTPGWSAAADEDGERLYYNADAELVFDFYVSADYSANATVTERGDLRTTSTNPDLTSAAAAAASNIAGILAANKDKSDVDKLTAYKDKICELVDYNHAAAADPTTPYGDPWQLIFVFDGVDEPNDTSVVCEGYSKAFQYLCDNTLFDHAKIDCYSVSGFMDDDDEPERHMWNILHMENGSNYLADITNCDEGSVGNPDKLFLKGYASGSMGDGYVFDCGGDQSVIYTYNETTLDQFSRLQLKLSADDYAAGATPQPQDDEGYDFIKDKNLVKGEGIWVPKFASVTYEDEDGHEAVGQYEVTGVSIESQESETDADVITAPEFVDDEQEWYLDSEEFGTAVIKVDYRKLDGTDASYTFTVTVTDEAYVIDLERGEELENIDTILPGREFELYAWGARKKSTPGFEEPYSYFEIEDPDAYKWELPDGCDEYADIEVAEDGKSAVIRVKDADALRDALGTDDIKFKLCVKASLVAGNSELASKEFYIDVADEFIELEPMELPVLYMFSPVTVPVSVKRYSAGNDPVAISGAEFNWVLDPEDENALKIEKGATTDGVTEYTFTLLENRTIDLKLQATYGDGKTLERSYTIEENEFYLWFNISYNTLFSDGDANFDLFIPDSFKEKEDDYKLVVKAGDYSSEDENSGVSYELIYEEGTEEEGASYRAAITVDKSILKNADGSLEIVAELIPKSEEYSDQVAYRETTTAEVKEPSLWLDGIPEGETDLLTESSYSFPESGEAQVTNASGTADTQFHITDLVIEEGSDCLVYQHTDQYWQIRGTAEGDATVTLNGYLGNDENNTFSRTIVVHVKQEYYTVSITNLNNSSRFVPGAVTQLRAEVERVSLEGDSSDEYEYEWAIADDGSTDLAEFVDENGDVVSDPTDETVNVRFKAPENDPEFEDGEATIIVVVKKNGDEVARNATTLNVENEYYAAELEGFDSEMEVGETRSYPIVAKKYSAANPEGEVIDPESNNLSFSVQDYNEDVADITIEDNTLTITRKTGSGTWFYVMMQWNSGSTETSYEINSVEEPSVYLNYSSDYPYVFNNADLTLTLDMSGYADKYGDAWKTRRKVVYSIGTYDYEREMFVADHAFEDAYTTNDDGTEITLDGSKIAEAIGDNAENREFMVRAEIWEYDGENVLGESPVNSAETWLTSVITGADYSNAFSDREMVPEDAFSILEYGWAKVINEEHPDGYYQEEFRILNITSDADAQNPDEAGNAVISIERDEEGTEGPCWVVRALNPGTATVTVSYLDVNGEYEDPENETPYTLTFNVSVVTDKYEANIFSENNEYTGIPGDSLNLKASVNHYGLGVSDDEQFTYAWNLAEGCEGYASIEPDGDSAVLTFNDFPDGAGSYGFDVVLHVFNEQGDEVATQTCGFVLTDDQYVLAWGDFDPGMDVGDSVTVNPVIIHKQVGRDDQVITPSSMELYSNYGIDIERIDGETDQFTATRTSCDENTLYGNAEYTDDFGVTHSVYGQINVPRKNYAVTLDGNYSSERQVCDNEEGKVIEYRLDGFENLLEKDPDSLSFTAVANAYSDTFGYVELQDVITNVEITSEGKLQVTLDGTRIPYYADNAYDQIFIVFNAKRNAGEDSEISLIDEYWTDSVEVVWTCDNLGHDWGEPVYEWSENNSKCTAMMICARNISHSIAESAVITEEITKAPTETEAGTKILTATFTNDAFETQTLEVQIPPIGHEHAAGDPVTENEVLPTCEEPGSHDVVVYCSSCHEELSRETVTDDALGHDWDEGAPLEGSDGVIRYTCKRCEAIRDTVNDEAAAVAGMVNALPAIDELSLENKDAVIEANDAYEALTDDLKALISQSTVQKLKTALAKIAELEQTAADQAAADAVSEMILNDLPAAGDVTLDDKGAVQAARDAYNDLTDSQRALVDPNAMVKLAALEAAIAAAEQAQAEEEEALAVQAAINALPAAGDVQLTDKGDIEAARAAYDSLNDRQKDIVGDEALARLEAAEDALAALEQASDDQTIAEAVTEVLNDLPAAGDVTLGDGNLISSARAAYDGLTDAQRDLVDPDALAKLEAAEAAFAALEQAANDQAAADAVADVINNLPAADKITVDHINAVRSARESYDALTDAQKELIDSSVLAKLEAAEAAVEALGHVHDWTSGDVTVPPTATEDGIMTYTCYDCLATRTEAIPAGTHILHLYNINYNDDGKFILEGNESYSVFVETEQLTSLLKSGYKFRYTLGKWEWGDTSSFEEFEFDPSCYRVDTRIGEYIELNGYNFYRNYEDFLLCFRVELVKGDDVADSIEVFGYVVDEGVEPHQHVGGEPQQKNVTNPTCETAGSHDEVVYCTICNKELSRETVTDNALGHTLVHHPRVEPTASTDGTEEYWECSECQKLFADEDGTAEINAPEVIPATGADDNAPLKLEWNHNASELQGIIGKDFILGDCFYEVGNTITVVYKNTSMNQTYICKRVEESDGGTYVGYFLNGDTSGNYYDKDLCGHLDQVITTNGGKIVAGTNNKGRLKVWFDDVTVYSDEFTLTGIEDPYPDEDEWNTIQDAEDALSDAEQAASSVSENSSAAALEAAQAQADAAVTKANEGVQAAESILNNAQAELEAAQSSGDSDAIAEATKKVNAAEQSVADAKLTLAKAKTVSKTVTSKTATKSANAAKAAVSKTKSGTAANVTAATKAKTAADKAKTAAAAQVAAAKAQVEAAKAANNAAAQAEANETLKAANANLTKATNEAKAAATRLTSAKTALDLAKTAPGKVFTVAGSKYKVLTNVKGKTPGTVVLTAAKKSGASLTIPATVKLNKKTFKVVQIASNAFKGSKAKTVTVGANVNKIEANAFKGAKAKKLIVMTKLLKKANVKKCLSGSKVKTVQVKAGAKAKKAYKKIFTKKIAGKKVKIK